MADPPSKPLKDALSAVGATADDRAAIAAGLRTARATTPDPDGFNRAPGQTAWSLVHTRDGIRLLPEPAATARTDPAFKELFDKALARTTTTNWDTLRTDAVNADIKEILANGPPDARLRQLLEVRGTEIYWKPDTYFGRSPDPRFRWAHVLSQGEIKNVGGDPAAAVAAEDVAPVSETFHTYVYGHSSERLNNYLAGASGPEADAVRAMTAELGDGVRLRRAAPGERGFVEIGSLVFALVAVGSAVYVISGSSDRWQTAVEVGEQFLAYAAFDQLLAELGLSLGLVGGFALSLESDNPEFMRSGKEVQAAEEFLREHVPGSIIGKDRFGGDEFAPGAVEDARQLLFHSDPVRVDALLPPPPPEVTQPPPPPLPPPPAPAPPLDASETYPVLTQNDPLGNALQDGGTLSPQPPAPPPEVVQPPPVSPSSPPAVVEPLSVPAPPPEVVQPPPVSPSLPPAVVEPLSVPAPPPEVTQPPPVSPPSLLAVVQPLPLPAPPPEVTQPPPVQPPSPPAVVQPLPPVAPPPLRPVPSPAATQIDVYQTTYTVSPKHDSDGNPIPGSWEIAGNDHIVAYVDNEPAPPAVGSERTSDGEVVNISVTTGVIEQWGSDVTIVPMRWSDSDSPQPDVTQTPPPPVLSSPDPAVQVSPPPVLSSPDPAVQVSPPPVLSSPDPAVQVSPPPVLSSPDPAVQVPPPPVSPPPDPAAQALPPPPLPPP